MNVAAFLSRWAFAALTSVVLLACGTADDDELRQWMKEQRNAAKPKVEELPKPKQFQPAVYAQDGSIEPFSPQKLAQAFRSESTQRKSGSTRIGAQKGSLGVIPT